MINMVSATACAPSLAASVDMFAGRQVKELEDDGVSLTAVGISTLTAVELSGSIDQLEALRRNYTLRTTLPAALNVQHSWVMSLNWNRENKTEFLAMMEFSMKAYVGASQHPGTSPRAYLDPQVI